MKIQFLFLFVFCVNGHSIYYVNLSYSRFKQSVQINPIRISSIAFSCSCIYIIFLSTKFIHLNHFIYIPGHELNQAIYSELSLQVAGYRLWFGSQLLTPTKQQKQLLHIATHCLLSYRFSCLIFFFIKSM